MDKQNIGSFIAGLRKASNMTQIDLAERLNVSNRTISKWECGDGYPDLTLVPVIAGIFGITSDELLQGAYAAKEKAEINPASAKKKVFPIKVLYLLCGAAACLPLAVTALFTPFFPELIPAHYANGAVTRWGSKFENFVFPFMIIAIAVFLFFSIKLLVRYCKKNESETGIRATRLESLLFFFLLLILIALNILVVGLLMRGLAVSTAKYGTPALEQLQTGCLGFGIGLAFLGGLMPFVPKNPWFGLRTATSMASEKAWRVSNALAGITLGGAGLAVSVINLFLTKGLVNVYITIAVLFLSFVLIAVEQAVIARKH